MFKANTMLTKYEYSTLTEIAPAVSIKISATFRKNKIVTKKGKFRFAFALCLKVCLVCPLSSFVVAAIGEDIAVLLLNFNLKIKQLVIMNEN